MEQQRERFARRRQERAEELIKRKASRSRQGRIARGSSPPASGASLIRGWRAGALVLAVAVAVGVVALVGFGSARRPHVKAQVAGPAPAPVSAGALGDISLVVPSSGRVAGKGYAGWLELSWQKILASPGRQTPCETVSVGGQRVGLLTVATFGPGAKRYTCSEPAGRPLYVAQFSGECSTFKADHGRFGTTPSDLERCAKAILADPHITVTVDGRKVNPADLLSATGVFAAHLHKANPLHDPAGSGRSAAYGYGLLLSGFSTGIHIIHGGATLNNRSAFDLTFAVHVP